MTPEPTSDALVVEAELFIHLDLERIGAVLKAMEDALATGQGQLKVRGRLGRLVIARDASPEAGDHVTLTFVRTAPEAAETLPH